MYTTARKNKTWKTPLGEVALGVGVRKMSKVNKSLSDFASLTPLVKRELELHDPSEGHSKFWRIYLYSVAPNYYVARHWGRNGSKGQQMVEGFYSQYTAIESFTTLVDQKEDKGYRPEASPLDKIVREV